MRYFWFLDAFLACFIMLCAVPSLISRCRGTGTFSVPFPHISWERPSLLRCRPCFLRKSIRSFFFMLILLVIRSNDLRAIFFFTHAMLPSDLPCCHDFFDFFFDRKSPTAGSEVNTDFSGGQLPVDRLSLSKIRTAVFVVIKS